MSAWPASAARLHPTGATHETGSGPFVLTTGALIPCDAGDGGTFISEFRCVHRFPSQEARAEFRKTAEHVGIFLSEENQ